MDGASFDRLSLFVHRMNDRATRRQALRTLVVSGITAALTQLRTEDAAACTQRRHQCSRNGDCCGYPNQDIYCDALPSSCDRNGDRCCGRSGASCSRKCDCCRGLTCSGGRCRSSNDGGGSCGNTTCPSGQKCCTISGFPQCIDPDFLHCCQSAICTKGWDCCGKFCCSSGWKCCGNGLCCPDGWRCGKTACDPSRTSATAEASAESIPFAEPVPSDEQHWIEQGWLTVVGTK
jgi:hypothetical protein